MKRTPEFTLGLIGSILATIVNAIFVVAVGFLPATDGVITTWSIFWIGLALSVAAIVFSCLVNTKTKMCGIFLIILAVLIVFLNLWNIISGVLLLISGIMCLTRKVRA